MVRFGVVGTNWITEKFLDAAFLLDDFTLTAVYSRTIEKANDFAQKYNVINTFTDLECMAKSDDIDAVYIASPNSLHAEQAKLFMKNKKHVICEKPIASNALELKSMFETAKENKVLLMEALKSSFIPSMISVEENLHKVGKVRRYFSSFCQYSSRYDAYKQGNVLNAFKPELSNGALMDIGIYCIYPLVLLFGKPIEVKASGYMLDSGVDGEGTIILKYEDKEAVVMYSKITNSSLESEIQGEEGNILIDKISSPSRVTIELRDGTKEDISMEQVENTMYYEAKEFIDLIKKGKLESDRNSYENSLAVMEIIDEARRQIGLIFPADK